MKNSIGLIGLLEWKGADNMTVAADVSQYISVPAPGVTEIVETVGVAINSVSCVLFCIYPLVFLQYPLIAHLVSLLETS